jgi:hypothetical protein
MPANCLSPNLAGVCDNCAQPRWAHVIQPPAIRCPDAAELERMAVVIGGWTTITDASREHWRMVQKRSKSVRRWCTKGMVSIDYEHAMQAEYHAAWLGYQQAIRHADKWGWTALLRLRVRERLRGGQARLECVAEQSGIREKDLETWSGQGRTEPGRLYQASADPVVLTDCQLLLLATAVAFAAPWPGWDTPVQE